MNALLKIIIDPTGAAAHVDVEKLLWKAQHGSARVVAPFAGRNKGIVTAGLESCARKGESGLNGLLDLARQCRPWGAEPPSRCVDASGYIRPEAVCGAVMPYRQTVAISSTGTQYLLRALRWAQPLIWVDSSDTNIFIADLKFEGRPVWKSQNVRVNPLATFGASDAQRFVPGLPAFGNTDGDALDFDLDNDGAAADFAGIFIGVAYG